MDNRIRILEAALRVFAETGYRGATTRRIAQEADVNEVTLFRNFGSKEELMRAAVQHVAQGDELARLPALPADAYAELTAWAREHHRRLYSRASILRACLGESSEHPDMTNCVNAGPVRAGLELRRYLHLVRDQLGDQNVDVEVAAGHADERAVHRCNQPRCHARAVPVSAGGSAGSLRRVRIVGAGRTTQPHARGPVAQWRL